MDTDTVPIDSVLGPFAPTIVNATQREFIRAESLLPPSYKAPASDSIVSVSPGNVSMAPPPNLAAPPNFTFYEGSNATPAKCRYIGSPYTHQSAEVTKDSVLGSSKMATIENFENYYLREIVPKWGADWTEFRDRSMANIQKSYREVSMYSFVVRLLTKISLYACEGDKDCLAFYDTASTGCLNDFEGSDLRPDIIAKRTTQEHAQKIACGEESKTQVFWHEIESLVEVKIKFYEIPPSIQTGQYLHVLPRGIPSLAGMLYLAWDVHHFYIYWSDTSGIIRSHHYSLREEKSWDVLYRYVYTVINPLTDLPTRDPTMSINPNPISTEWTINCKERTFNAVQLYGATAHSRQTCVLWDPIKRRIIKDHWRDDDRRYRESNVLEKIKGVPGVSQVDFSEVVKRPSNLGELATSKLHSGRDSTLKLSGRRVPRRTKQRSVLKSRGDPLSARRSVRQILVALYDSIQGHQICVKKKRVLHRDVSRYNILINPEHFDTELDDKLDDGSDVKFINQVLDPSLDRVKEEGILIDWDNAAELDEDGVGDVLTERTGTPMFVSLSVGSGAIKIGPGFRGRFPVLTGKAKDLYIKAYGQDIYDRYLNVVEQSDRARGDDDEVPHFKHAAHHDLESFFWVLLYELLVALPEKKDANTSENDKGTSENNKDISASANALLLLFEGHEFGSADFRADLLSKGADYWKGVLHPRLNCLAELVSNLCRYFKTEWAYWSDLPEDHVHEAFKRLLLAEILKMDAANDPIALSIKERKGQRHPDAIRNSSLLDSFETISPRKSGSKRSHSDMTGTREGSSLKRSKEDTNRPLVDVFGSPSDANDNQRLSSFLEESSRKLPLGREGTIPLHRT